jgi:hypothetical protein
LFTLQAVTTTLVKEYFERKNNEKSLHIRTVVSGTWRSTRDELVAGVSRPVNQNDCALSSGWCG